MVAGKGKTFYFFSVSFSIFFPYEMVIQELTSNMGITGELVQKHVGSCPVPDPLNQHLHFNKISFGLYAHCSLRNTVPSSMGPWGNISIALHADNEEPGTEGAIKAT